MANLCKCGKGRKNERWYPNSVNDLDKFLAQLFIPLDTNNVIPAVRKNMAYNIQYLEYLRKTLNDLDLSGVLLNQTFKTFIIIGMSLVEAILAYLLEKDGNHKTIEWKTIEKKHNTLKNNNRLIVEIQEKLDIPDKVPMGFDTMCNKVSGKKLLGNSDETYDKLKKLKLLRNKVHIYDVKGLCDTDYHKFNREEYLLMKSFLYELFTGDLFIEKSDLFDFLKAV